MKSDNDLQNSDNCVVLKTVSPQILDKLRESGLTVCTCCEFPGTAWLVFRPNMPISDIHGGGYDFEEIGLFGTEAVLKYFEANTPNYVDAELMSINLLTFVCSLNKLTVFNFEFNTCTVIIVS